MIVIAALLIATNLFGAPPASRDARRINTAGWEDSPFLSGDGQLLYFMYTPWNFFDVFLGRARLPERRGPDRPGHESNPDPWRDANIYVARRNPDGNWGVPLRLFTGCCAMTQDGTTFYLQVPGPKDANEIATMSRTASGGWSGPAILGDEINSRYKEDNPHFIANPHQLFWTSDRPGGFGGNDLWYSFRKSDGSWAKARNMGPGINTPNNEDQIWVSADGKTAYFTRYLSSGPQLFKSERVAKAWTQASPVEFEGGPVPAGEPSLSADGREMVMMTIDPQKRDFLVSASTRTPGGRWSHPRPIDAY